jgi:hypothetical protein
MSPDPGKRIYGDFPTRQDMAARMKRERATDADLFPALEEIIGRGYYIRVIARRYPVGTIHTYRYRRDGRIEQSWVPVDDRYLTPIEQTEWK